MELHCRWTKEPPPDFGDAKPISCAWVIAPPGQTDSSELQDLLNGEQTPLDQDPARDSYCDLREGPLWPKMASSDRESTLQLPSL